jgi:transketolase
MPQTQLDIHCSNAIRVLTMDAVQKANSGHPGMPMGMADVAYILWTRHLKHNPTNPTWPNRDRFILSAGHGSMLLYSLLYLTGYPLSLDDIKQFRQWESPTPGHPEFDPEIGVEMTTGPLGQGFATGVGMAIAQKHLAVHFNKPDYPVFDNKIYSIVSDGDMMEGITHEAASIAGHLHLDNLIYLYDDNEISIEGSTDITFTENVGERFKAYGWHVQDIDGHDPDAIDAAIRTAQTKVGKPHLIVCHTHIAKGSVNLEDSHSAHGAPLGSEEIRLTKENMRWPSMEPFFIPDDVMAYYRLAIPQGEQVEAQWREVLTQYAAAYPDAMQELNRRLDGKLPNQWEDALPTFTPADGPIATRAASGKVLANLADAVPELVGGSADLEPSNKTYLPKKGDFQVDSLLGRNFHFGVREHIMGAILNGITLYGGLRAYGGTFLVFSDYMRPAVRLAALMKLPVTYVWTHDSFYVGEDGPTHEPVEHIASLRAIPGLTVIRPADANETTAAWKVALENSDGPVALALTRQKLPVINQSIEQVMEGVSRGAYVVSDSPLNRIDIILIATGSEVADALEAQKILGDVRIGARVVSMPSWELFEKQPLFYKLNVLPENVTRRLAIEAGVSLGWERYVGNYGDIISINHFGASAPASVLKEAFGFTSTQIAERAQKLLAE